MKQLKHKDIATVKKFFVEQQNYKCAVCDCPIDLGPMTHLDHCHQYGHVRSALCSACNSAEGTIHHKWLMSGLKGKGVDYVTWLRNLANYLSQDYSTNDYHPNHPTDQAKMFSRLTLADQKAKLNELGIKYPEKVTKADLVKLYKKSFATNPRCDFNNGKYDSVSPTSKSSQQPR